MRTVALVRLALVLMVSLALGWPGGARADEAGSMRLYTVGVSHLDTQWYFNIQETISQHIPRTFTGTFELFEKYPDFKFSWEGAYRYMLLEEYYPEIYAELLEWTKKGRWAAGGSALEAGDVNVPSPEALFRHFLIGNRYFRERLGKGSVDVFLPDCFGFGYALPAVAGHCGLIGFSTQKLYWQPIVDIPFGVGVWRGVGGSELVAALRPRGYTDPVDHDLSGDVEILQNCSAQFPEEELEVGFTYFGVGDEGGPVREEDVEWVQKSVVGSGPIEVRSSFSDEIFRDLSAEQIASLPRYDGELLLTTHGTGAYTSQSALKRWNRDNELLAGSVEKAAVLADWLGLQEYPYSQLYDSWVRFLAQHFHDVLPGTSTADVYLFAWNDELLALNRLSHMLSDAVGALARILDTEVEGVPLVVFNPLAMSREDLVEAKVRYEGKVPDHVQVFGPDGSEVPSQVVDRGEGWLDVVFVAQVGSVGLGVFDVRASDQPSGLETGLSATEGVLESGRFKVVVDGSGDIASVFDKLVGKELLSAPVRLGVWDNNSSVWPAWEVLWSDLSVPAREYVSGPAEVEVVEAGPARVALEVRRTNGASSYAQRVSLAAGGAGDRVEVETRFDWQSRSSLLKAVFPLASPNAEATYDLGVGTIARGNNTERRYEVPAQRWVDLTAPDGSFGVSISSDNKYGWDKPDDGTLRLTLVQTPLDWTLAPFRYGQHTQDLGPHVTSFAIWGHEGSWQGGTWRVAARFNEPPLAFQPPRRKGEFGRQQALVELSGGEVALTALKRAEDGDGVVVRVVEKAGEESAAVKLAFGSGIEGAQEVNGVEDPVGDAQLKDGVLQFAMKPYQIRSFRIRPTKGFSTLASPSSRPVELEYNVDVFSMDSDRSDGVMGLDEFKRDVSIPGELVPEKVTEGGIEFELGPSAKGALNAVECRGQTVDLPATEPGDRLYVLASARGEQQCRFVVGSTEQGVTVPDFTGLIGNWVGRVWLNRHLDDPSSFLIPDAAKFIPPFYKQQRVAWYTTHRHLPDADDPYEFTYMYRFELQVPEGATQVILPNNDQCVIFALSLSNTANSLTLPASRTFDEQDTLARKADWSLMNASVDHEPPVEPSPEVVEGQGDVVSEDTGPGKKSGGGGCGLAGTQSASWPLLWMLAALAFALVVKKRRANRL